MWPQISIKTIRNAVCCSFIYYLFEIKRRLTKKCSAHFNRNTSNVFVFFIDKRWTLNLVHCIRSFFFLQFFLCIFFFIFIESLPLIKLCSALVHRTQKSKCFDCLRWKYRKWALIERLLLTPCLIPSPCVMLNFKYAIVCFHSNNTVRVCMFYGTFVISANKQ